MPLSNKRPLPFFKIFKIFKINAPSNKRPPSVIAREKKHVYTLFELLDENIVEAAVGIEGLSQFLRLVRNIYVM